MRAVQPSFFVLIALIGGLAIFSSTLSVLSLVFGLGLGFATVTSSTAALVADLTQDGRFGSSMGVLRAVMDVGQSIGPVLTGFIVGVAGYGNTFTLLAAILVAAALMLGLLLRDG